MSIDCDDKDAEKLTKRVPAYLISLGVLDVKVIHIESLRLEGSKD
jgi:hypothetical protein